MKTSVVVSTYDRSEELIACLQSVVRQFEPPDEIIVVDDGDTQQTAERLTEAGLEDDIVHVEGPSKSLPAARNHGVERASGDVICFIDDDVVVPPTWLSEMLETYEEENDAVGVGGHVLNFNPKEINKANVDSFGYRAITGLRVSFLLNKIGVFSPVGILWTPHIFVTSGIQDVEAFQGCNMSFRREVFEEHRFDEWYGASGSSTCEELDFCARLSADGHRLVYNPRATVIHKRKISDGSRPGGPNYNDVSNLVYFILSNPKLGLRNYLLFCTAVFCYSVARRDFEYLDKIKDGTMAYVTASGTAEPDDGGEGG